MFRAAALWAIAALAAGVIAALSYEPEEDAPFSAADLEALLAGDLEPVVVADAVDGFGSATVAGAGGGCERIRFVMATEMDNLELNEALSLWVETHPGSAVEAADGHGVTLRRCP